MADDDRLDCEEPPEGPPRLVCRCVGVSSTRIAARARCGAITVGEIQADPGAGTGCTSCHPEIDEILEAVCGVGVAPETRRRNRDVCARETRQRVEAALFQQIAPRLPAGYQIELVGVQGLIVDVHLEPDDEAQREQVASRLRKLVCPDVEVLFS